MDAFCAALKNPVVSSAEDNSGTEDFQNLQLYFFVCVILR